MTARHILTYAHDLGGGGVEHAMLRLAGGWAAAGRRVTLVYATRGTATIPAGVEPVALGSAHHRALLALPRLVRAMRPDILFCPGNHYTSVAAWTRLRLGTACPPIVGKMSNATARGERGAIAAFGERLWFRTHSRFLDRLVAMTPGTAEAAAVALGMSGRTQAIANPPRAADGAAAPDLPPRFLLGIGRLAPQKRWDRLIDALPRIADRSIPLLIFGAGPLRADLLARARALGVADRLVLPGETPAPLGVMARAAAMVLPSAFEGTPGVLHEALAVGTPVVATYSSPSIAEILADPARGTIVAQDDPRALVTAIDHWLAGGTPRPVPSPQPGADAVVRYLALFDSLTA